MMRMVFLSIDSGALYSDGGIESQPEWFLTALEVYRVEVADYLKSKSQ